MNGTAALRRSVGAGAGAISGGAIEPAPIATLVVYKDDAGFGMKVSGDNPVYVQSVKEGGAAARAGLHAGDKIIKVNGVNVMQSTHTDVVQLIKSSTQVVLTVQQKPVTSSGGAAAVTAIATATTATTTSGLQVGVVGATSQQSRPVSLSTAGNMSPSQPVTSLHRASTAPAGSAPCNTRITAPQPVDLEKKRQLETQRVHTFQLMLEKEQSYVDKLRSELAKNGTGNSSTHITAIQAELAGAERRVRTLQEQLAAISTTNEQLCSLVTNTSCSSGYCPLSSSGSGADMPPPLPSRKSLSMQSLSPPPLPPRPPSTIQNTVQPERHLLIHLTPSTVNQGISNSFSQDVNLNASNALSKHQRTKSSPEQLGITAISPSEASKRLIASESMNDLLPPRHVRHNDIDINELSRITPPGTPPPPYPAPVLGQDVFSSTLNDALATDIIPGLPTFQQPIMSMEEDDVSDQEIGQLEDHGPFQSLSRLWGHHAHLAVFINYVLSNSDPSSLLFYLVTDLYKEGNAKEMKKWAYEIHSSFLVPGAPLCLHNVDENVANEIDDVLLKESDKEEILRKIFWKARTRAKEELNEQLTHFQQKRTAGLATIFGPTDISLDESMSDKSRETKIIETYLLPKMEPYLEDIEKEHVDLRLFTTAAGLATILIKIFQLRPVWIDRVPTFVAKDKSNIKARLLIGKSRKMTIRGHHFVAHQYFTITYCNHCQLIIGGIGPQGYLCNDCSLNVHRQCVRVVEENCPGPLMRKERANDRISKLMERIRPERKLPSSHHHSQNYVSHLDKIKKSEEDSGVLTDGENGEHRTCNLAGNIRNSCERMRISSLGGINDHTDNMDNPSSREDISEMVQQNISSKPKTSNINRSESYKERIHHKRQLREKRKTSDPNLSKTKVGSSDCEPSGIFPGNSAGSSSNSSLSTRSLDSPSTSLEQVHPTSSAANASTSWDSDVDVEADPPDWSQAVTEDVLAQLSNSEKKRQDVINELFHTERSHVRALKVLSHVFHKPLLESQVLPLDQIQLLFSNLDEMLMIHSHFNQAMKRKKKENPCVSDVGELLLEMFDGDAGEIFEKAASTYCAKQQVALDALRDRRRKDSKLNAFLNDIEANPLCRRLQLKDHILTGMLRLTKYPLLFENLAKYTPNNNEKEKAAILRSLERSKEILSRVNQAVKEAEDHQRLTEIQRTIDRSAFDKFDHPTVQEFKNLDITKRKLIYEGPLQWRRTEPNRSIPNRSVPKPVDLHVVLLDDTIFFLHRQDDKYLLKFINTTNQAGNSVLSPIVKLSTVLVRHNAAEKDSLYLVNTSENGAQMYNLVAPSSAERKLWCKHISEAVEAYKARDRHDRRSTPSATLAEEPMHSMEDASPSGMETDGINIEKDQPEDRELRDLGQNTVGMQEHDEEMPETTITGTPTTEHIQQRIQSTESSTTGMIESLRMVTCTQLSLIDPLEVHVEAPPVHVAEPILTPIECLRRKDEIIKQALREKQLLMADILNIPKEDFEHVADIASEPSTVEKEPTELILAAITQTDQLMGMLNSSLNISETETIFASCGSSTLSSSACEATGCPSFRNHSHPQQSVMGMLQPICYYLTSQLSQLSQLLEIVKEREEEREKLRKELRRSRERIHALDIEVQRREFSELMTTTTHTQTMLDDIVRQDNSSNDFAHHDELIDTYGETATADCGYVEDLELKVETEGDNIG
ncbi:PREDICTED: rho guanine nucleotide exchange factor 11 isoform X1 [Atta colombica]|uniref:rho guanine nucleotide exchange factor 11 isoform X1 n=1 Tax=Atta colombica TaxID=520822 RepID=UPI00084C02A4|nr:PREDICTED: rho guanine nucleotide exchange factor 11 isoform X1 [Atta colombica]XP_018052536.1 PREDICTED: rho guanine nucleotide exchange factor 11 isoform X1 [Atta colombica]XP_018052537.1 PREDICTED: rho guanine nucleotide exchange factor 11 isoform X1 [Atta colombica]XP_018052538.1 PREDICTED: rho guanine nucleotide exchange factor 11 isoform X1 [Atta colombica]XP_018052539.1 PREDICTED: rho guanine nucleotide exchange factor 11 isoform X1 [Atta colombica]